MPHCGGPPHPVCRAEATENARIAGLSGAARPFLERPFLEQPGGLPGGRRCGAVRRDGRNRRDTGEFPESPGAAGFTRSSGLPDCRALFPQPAIAGAARFRLTAHSAAQPGNRHQSAGGLGAETRPAPLGGRRRLHGKSGLPSVHLHPPSRPIVRPGSARLPRLVARGYTGLSCPDAGPLIPFYDGSATL
jgi:hypothetical protein